ncbi:type II secretion system F family protein [Candidatus Nomurabacteria bacterium]|nr:type II secretion system F family protein [Candidatus Nomurabacteria bacterium]
MWFSYQVVNKKGKIISGNIEARAEDLARTKLVEKKGTVLSLNQISKPNKEGLQIVIGRVKLMDKMIFAKHLAVMIRSGMPLDESLDTLMQQSSPPMAKRIKRILFDVKQGNSLSNALRKQKRVFDTMFINMVAAGEASGQLEQNLNIVATQQEKNYTLRSKIKAAMLYPTVIFLAIIGLLAVIAIFVLPKLIGFFSTLNANLPLSTRILIAGSDFLVNNWPLVFGGIILLFIAIKVMTRFAKTRFILHLILLRIPIFGKISKNMNLAIFCRSLSSLLSSGITIDQALNIVSDTVTNDSYKHKINAVYHQVLKGSALSEVLLQDKSFPILVSRMSKVGERSGNLAETLDYLADFYETEVDNTTKNLSTMLEPALLVFIGLAVGFVAISIINPIYELTSKVGA